MQFEEHRIQKGFIEWFEYQYPQYAPFLFAIPNGGKRGKAEAGRLKAEGVRKGIPDLFLSVPAGVCHGLYIETKTPKGNTTKEQKYYLEEFCRLGYRTTVCRGLEDFTREINKYLSGN